MSDYNISTFNCEPEVYRQLESYQSLEVHGFVGVTKKYLKLASADVQQERVRIRTSKITFCATSDMAMDGSDPVTAIAKEDSTAIELWSMAAGTVISSVDITSMKITALSIYRGSEFFIAVATEDYSLLIWDASNKTVAQTFTGHSGLIHSINISSSVNVLEIVGSNDIPSLCIASASNDRTARTWSLEKGKRLRRFDHDWDITFVVVANKRLKRPVLATGGENGVIKLWDMKSGIGLRSLCGHLARITSMCLYEGFQVLLVTGSADKTLRVYDIVSGENLAVLQGHAEEVYSACIIGDDEPVILSSSRDRTLMQWNLQEIICQFYYTAKDMEVDHEVVGDRNSNNHVCLPTVTYTPSTIVSDDEDSEDEEVTDPVIASITSEDGHNSLSENCCEGDSQADGSECYDEEGEEKYVGEEEDGEESDGVDKTDEVLAASGACGHQIHPLGGDGAPAAGNARDTSMLSTASMIVRKFSISVVNSILPGSIGPSSVVTIQPIAEATESPIKKSSSSTARSTPSKAKRSKVQPGTTMPTQQCKTNGAGQKNNTIPIKKHAVGRVKVVIQQYGAVLSPQHAESLQREKEEKLRQRKLLMKKRRMSMDRSVDRAVIAAKKRMEEIKKYI